MINLLLFVALAGATDDCVRVPYAASENIELVLSARFFARGADSSVPAGVATDGWFVAPGPHVCDGEDSELTLFNGERSEALELRVSPLICEFITDVRTRMRADATLRLSLFGQRRDDTAFGRPIGSHVTVLRACVKSPAATNRASVDAVL